MGKLRVAIVNNMQLPLPAVRGGAVETLIQLLLDKNEESGDFHFEVFSINDSQARKAASKYRNASFHYIDNSSKIYQARKFLNRFIHKAVKMLGGTQIPEPFYKDVAKIINRCNDVDAMLFEGIVTPVDYIKKKTGVTVVQRYHNTPTLDGGRFSKNSVRSTDLYLGISKFICRQLEEQSGGVRPVECLYNSIDPSKFQRTVTSQEKRELREKLGIPRDNFVILYTGRLVPQKGVKELIDAFKESGCSEASLVIVGASFFDSSEQTPYLNELRESARDAAANIKFTGYVCYSEMYKYYSLADVCVFPSVWEEPFALTCLEAMACGKPVIVTRSGGMAEVVDEHSAIIVEKDENLIPALASALADCVDGKHDLIAMGAAGQRRSNLFSCDNHYCRFKELIKRYV